MNYTRWTLSTYWRLILTSNFYFAIARRKIICTIASKKRQPKIINTKTPRNRYIGIHGGGSFLCIRPFTLCFVAYKQKQIHTRTSAKEYKCYRVLQTYASDLKIRNVMRQQRIHNENSITFSACSTGCVLLWKNYYCLLNFFCYKYSSVRVMHCLTVVAPYFCFTHTHVHARNRVYFQLELYCLLLIVLLHACAYLLCAHT